MRFFTSDFHFGSSSIIRYARRPYSSAAAMAECIIAECNAKATKADVLFHVGDFALVGVDRHDEEDDIGISAEEARNLLAKINTNVILLDGNHDTSHNFPAMCSRAVIDLNPTWHGITVSHFPLAYAADKLQAKDKLKVHFCGHVHEKWKVKYTPSINALDINVGLDAWNQHIVSELQLAKLLDELKTTKILSRLVEKHEPFTATAAQLELVLNRAWSNLRTVRAVRKHEKHLKKGLTPEECERRKQAALAAKGIKMRSAS